MDQQTITQAVKKVCSQLQSEKVPLGVSNRHLHLTQEHFDVLFPNQELTVKKPLRQPGHFAAEQTVNLIGPKSIIRNVRILGPFRSQSQIEVSKTDARMLGVNAPYRLSGDLSDTPGIILRSEFAEIELDKGVIVALRHIHMPPLEALVYGVEHGDVVEVAIEGGNRNTVLSDVSIRVDPKVVLEMHVDTDEANAIDADNPNAYARILTKTNLFKSSF
ncbi:MAG: phosphate propanoyltransferase [Vibrio sp.]